MVAIPVLVAIFLRVNRTYEGEDRELLDGLARLEQTPPSRQVAVVLVDDVDEQTLHAVQYALTIRPQELHAIHMVADPSAAVSLRDEWEQRLPGCLWKRFRVSTGSVPAALPNTCGSAPTRTRRSP